jgi:hypothetical protein
VQVAITILSGVRIARDEAEFIVETGIDFRRIGDIRIGGLGLDIIPYVLFQYSNYFLCNVLSDFLCSLLY